MTHERFIHVTGVAFLVAALLGPAAAAEGEPEHPDGYFIQADGPLEPDAVQDPLNLSRDTLEAEYPLVRDAVDEPGAMIQVPDDGTLDAFWDAMDAHDALAVDGAVYRIAVAMAAPPAPPAAQGDGEGPRGDPGSAEGVIAKERRPDEPAARPWVMTLEELDAEYPAIARAVRNADTLVSFTEEERSHVDAFLERMSGNGYGALEVAGTQYDVALAMKGGTLPASDETGGDDVAHAGLPVPGAFVPAVLGVLGVAAVGLAARKP